MFNYDTVFKKTENTQCKVLSISEIVSVSKKNHSLFDVRVIFRTVLLDCKFHMFKQLSGFSYLSCDILLIHKFHGSH